MSKQYASTKCTSTKWLYKCASTKLLHKFASTKLLHKCASTKWLYKICINKVKFINTASTKIVQQTFSNNTSGSFKGVYPKTKKGGDKHNYLANTVAKYSTYKILAPRPSRPAQWISEINGSTDDELERRDGRES